MYSLLYANEVSRKLKSQEDYLRSTPATPSITEAPGAPEARQLGPNTFGDESTGISTRAPHGARLHGIPHWPTDKQLHIERMRIGTS